MTTSKATAKPAKPVKLTYKAAHVKAQAQRNQAKAARRLQVKPSVNLSRPSEYKNNMSWWQFKVLQAALKASRVKPVYISHYEAVGYVPNEVVAVSAVKTTLHHALFSPFAFELITNTVVNYGALGVKKHAKKAVKQGSTAAKGAGAYVGKAYGVNYPKSGGVVYDLWQFFDAELAKGNEVNGKLVKAHCVANNINTTTGSCQLWAWRKYQAHLTA